MEIDEMIAKIEADSKTCDCGNPHSRIPIDMMTISDHAYDACSYYLLQKKFHHVLVIADEQTYRAAGDQLVSTLRAAGIVCSVCTIEPTSSGDVVANETSIVQAFIEINDEVDALLAVGSGTIHDITRFCSAKARIPFISIPTAASVDGFTSLGAPLIVKGMKKTFQTVSPIALFADITVLMKAPREMTAAGFGDMLAKYTSLADWKFGHLVHNEPYCPLAASITNDSLARCIEKIDDIAKGTEEGIRVLLTSLIQSGLAMLLFGQSHPASGGEHHLSHYWEMTFLQTNRPQVLHGSKVGVSSCLLAKRYKEWFENGSLLPKALSHKQKEVESIISHIPTLETIQSYLEKVGGPTTPAELAISDELVNESLQKAHLLRDRFTMLKCFTINIDK